MRSRLTTLILRRYPAFEIVIGRFGLSLRTKYFARERPYDRVDQRRFP